MVGVNSPTIFSEKYCYCSAGLNYSFDTYNLTQWHSFCKDKSILNTFVNSNLDTKPTIYWIDGSNATLKIPASSHLSVLITGYKYSSKGSADSVFLGILTSTWDKEPIYTVITGNKPDSITKKDDYIEIYISLFSHISAIIF